MGLQFLLKLIFNACNKCVAQCGPFEHGVYNILNIAMLLYSIYQMCIKIANTQQISGFDLLICHFKSICHLAFLFLSHRNITRSRKRCTSLCNVLERLTRTEELPLIHQWLGQQKQHVGLGLYKLPDDRCSLILFVQ